MVVFERKFVEMCLSLLCLPILLTIVVVTLPITFPLYIIAWSVHLLLAQTDSYQSLPYSPLSILKINYVVFGHIAMGVTLVPQAFAYLIWRYWNTGPSGATEGVRRDVPYHSDAHKHHTYDLYFPVHTDIDPPEFVPIVVYIHGGAWAWGSKELYGLLAHMLRKLGYIVVVPDFRKYPEVRIEGVYEDIRHILEAVNEEGESWGGDVDQIFIMGHSSGAQLATQVTLSEIVEEVRARAAEEVGSAKETGTANSKVNGAYLNGHGPKSKLPRIEGLILLAGVYDIETHYEFETLRGVQKLSSMGRCMGGTRESFIANSPLHLLPRYNTTTKSSSLMASAMSRCLAESIPRIMLVHGERDTTVPPSSTVEFYKAIGDAIHECDRDTVDVRVRLYKRMGHTDVITALMPNNFQFNRSRGPLIRDLKEFIQPDLVESEEDD